MLLNLVAGILGEVWSTGYCRGAIDWWQQREVPAGVGHLAAAERDRQDILLEPEALVRHPAREDCLGLPLALLWQFTPPL